jgi:hypothetical protein
MELFFIVFFVMLILIAAMSVGVLMGKEPISGSCGGMSALGMEVACDVCAGDKTKCENEGEYDQSQEVDSSTLAYNAMSKKG